MTRRRGREEPVVGVDEWDEAGWARSVSTGAIANGAWLARKAAWLLVFSGPLLGGAALLASMVPAADASPRTAPVRPAATAAADAVGPAGFADLYVEAYVAAGHGSEQQLAAYFPAAAQLTFSGTPGAQHASGTAAVRVQQVASGYWSVTVATQVTGSGTPGTASGSGLRYFEVAVRGSGEAFTAAALPAEVSAPSGGTAVSLGYGDPQPVAGGDPAAQTVQEFLSGYLAGDGDLTRDLSPGTVIAPVQPAPYSQVSIAQIAQAGAGSDEGDEESSRAVPADGTVRQLLVDVSATDRAGVVRPLTYAIELRARAGRWEVQRLQSAPLLASAVSNSGDGDR